MAKAAIFYYFYAMVMTFKDLLNQPVLKKFCNVAQKNFGVTIALIRPDFENLLILGSREKFNPFCRMLQNDFQGKKLCLNCDYLHLQEAKLLKKPYRYFCHAGLTDFIIPIYSKGDLVAFLQCGQIMDKKPSAEAWSKIRTLFQGLNLNFKRLKEAYFKTRVVKPDIQESLIEFLEIFAGYVVDAGAKLLLYEKDRKSQIIYRASSYIKENLISKISLESIAKAANTSKRNLTRVFYLENKMTVLEFIQKCRVEKACKMLQDKNNKISGIAFDCGFGSVQGFNRSFKSIMGQTPRKWRTTGLPFQSE